ncbi:MAG: HlyD family efflux transporter periplasmic adaptor subunit [Burkholderiaceae bacterium]
MAGRAGAGVPGQGQPNSQLLPPLREDLKLFSASENRDGSPAWVIQDPVRNRFFRVGWVEFEVLSRWKLRDPALIASEISARSTLEVTPEQVVQVAEFFRQQQLVHVRDASGVAYLGELARRATLSRWKWLLHNYLFIRIPLVRPQRFLQWLAPWCAFFYTRTFAIAAIASAVLGLVLALRQWDVFLTTFTDTFSPAGIAGYLAALFVAKTLHEMGHAITATRLGVRVAHMGVAFLVLWPMLYTDTGESWKLSERRDRFRIAAAGMATEFALASFATLTWSLTADGPMRSALFFLATTSWVITVGINASPFMRFDGYFLLSDTLDLPNLHSRSFAMARAALRRTLFGWREPDPESFEPRMRRFLITFAWLTWTYRLIVFIGIAIAVYVFFFKVLGIFLFVVEIAWFIVRPIWKEAAVWIQRRSETGMARGAVLLLLVLGVAGFMALPWQRSVSGEAWLHSAQSQTLYSPFAAQVLKISDNGIVPAGTVLAELNSPETQTRAAQLKGNAEALRRELYQSVGQRDGAERRNLIIEQLGRELAALESERDELLRLRLVAPYDGQLVDRDPTVAPGTWVSANQPLAVFIDPSSWVIDALVDQEDVDRIQAGALVRFYERNSAADPLTGKVQSVDSVVAQSLPDPIMAAETGGRVPTVRLPDGRIAPRDAMYRVRVSLDDSSTLRVDPRMLLGTVSIVGESRSPLVDWVTTAIAVLIRESGF